MWGDATWQYHHKVIKAAVAAYGDGQDRLCAELVAYAPLMADLFEHLAYEKDMDPGGVCAYEVASPFGLWYLNYLSTNGHLPGGAECRHMMAELATNLFVAGGYKPEDLRECISDFFKGR
jgi:hypothetical protein